LLSRLFASGVCQALLSTFTSLGLMHDARTGARFFPSHRRVIGGLRGNSWTERLLMPRSWRKRERIPRVALFSLPDLLAVDPFQPDRPLIRHAVNLFPHSPLIILCNSLLAIRDAGSRKLSGLSTRTRQWPICRTLPTFLSTYHLSIYLLAYRVITRGTALDYATSSSLCVSEPTRESDFWYRSRGRTIAGWEKRDEVAR